MPKLSDSLARAAVPRPGKGETVIYDDELKGFALRIRASGSKSWIWRRRKPDGTPERYTIGTFPAMRAAAAREVARQRDAEHNAILHGVPVERLDRTYHRARRLEPTLGEIADQWIERFEGLIVDGKRRRSTLKDYTRHLTVDLAPLRSRPAKTLTHPEVSAAIEEIEAERGGSEARAARATLSSMCSWALKTGRMLTNPVIGSYKPEPGHARERVLSDEELSEIWRAAGEHGGDVAPIVRLLILTGQRREEIGGLRWSEVDVPNLRLDLSGARTKNGRPHLVPLAPPVLETIRALPRRRGEDGQIRDLLFGTGSGGFAGWSHAKLALDVRIARSRAQAAGTTIEIPQEVNQIKNQWTRERAVLAVLGNWALPHWTLHDLRRAFSTHANELSLADPHVIDAFINHISGQAKAGVAGTYNRAAYWDQRVELARRWAKHIISVVNRSTGGT